MVIAVLIFKLVGNNVVEVGDQNVRSVGYRKGHNKNACNGLQEVWPVCIMHVVALFGGNYHAINARRSLSRCLC